MKKGLKFDFSHFLYTWIKNENFNPSILTKKFNFSKFIFFRRKEESLKKKQLDEAYEKFMATLEKIKGPTIGVERTNELQAQRSKLPIFAEEQPIVEAINENSV